jgi:hypothetical protein
MFDKKYMFLIQDDEVHFLDYSVFLLHKDWAKSLGINEDEFIYTIRGTCTKIDGKWIANFYCEHDQEDGRCAAAARKFAPVIMEHCKASSLEILSDEEPFTINKKIKKKAKKKTKEEAKEKTTTKAKKKTTTNAKKKTTTKKKNKEKE